MSNNAPPNPRMLIADDDQFVREHVALLLHKIGVDVVQCADGAEAIQRLGEPFAAAIVDLDMPGATGLEVLAVTRNKAANLPVIILSGAGEVADAVLALKRGAFDYITKPFDPEELTARVRECLRVAQLQHENAALKADRKATGRQVELIAHAETSKKVVALAERCAAVNSNVLITGPSGTGKSMLARWIHQHSERSEGPFVTVNCGALPRELIESELFGHEKGAFTGAVSARTGRFEAAHGGTLFLDELGELPLELQPKLLNVIQDRVVSRLGGTSQIDVDVRLIAATNRDLTLAVEQREFREDLYFRLNVLTLEVPSLAERADDIVPLARYTLQRVADRMGLAHAELGQDAEDELRNYAWPGNVRELENVLERALVFTPDGPITTHDLRLHDTHDGGPGNADLIEIPLSELERRSILANLAHFGGNRAETARALGVSERTIYNRLKEYGSEHDQNIA